MRLTRRSLLAGLGQLGALAPVRPAEARLAEATPIAVRATPITAFRPSEPDRRRFGGLTFRSGLRLASPHAEFGGFSGLWRAPDGQGIVAVSDRGNWLTGQIAKLDGRLVGLQDARLAPILRADGVPLNRTRAYDTEGLAIANGVAYIPVERVHQVLRFEFGKEGVSARGREMPVPREVKRLPSNRSLEAVGVAPPGHPLAGALVAIAERSGAEDAPTLGVILTGPKPGLFQVARPGSYDITDLAFLPGGDMLLLERWYRPWRGVSCRIRQIPAAMLMPGAVLDGPVLMEADLSEEIDNMEGLAVHIEAGRTLLTLISDDNFSALQRTLLLEFALA